jgi:hypothetical protein
MTTTPHRRRGITLLAVALLAGAATVSTAGPAFADPSPVPTAPSGPGGANAAAPGAITWSVQPSTKDGPDRRPAFTYTNIAGGTIVNDYVAVTNFSKMPVTFEVYASDAFNTTSGSLDLLAASDKPKDIGGWVSMTKKTITLNPNERANEPFTLTVPANASPGDHVGGIIASVSNTDTTNKNLHVDQRLAAPIYLRVAGDVHSGVAVESVSSSYHGTINPFGGGGTDVAYTLHNTGNARVDVATDIAVKGLFGLTLGKSTAPAIKDLLPGATIRVTQHISGVFPLGPLSARVQANPATPAGMSAFGAAPVAVSSEAGVFATPWSQLLVLLLLVAAGFVVRWYLLRGKERTQETVAKAVAKAKKETVEQLVGASEEPPTAAGTTPSERG